MQLKNNIKLDDLEYTTKDENVKVLVKTLYFFFFKRYTQEKFVIRRCL